MTLKPTVNDTFKQFSYIDKYTNSNNTSKTKMWTETGTHKSCQSMKLNKSKDKARQQA